MNDVGKLVSDPRFLAYKFNFATEVVEFIRLSENDLSSATWLSAEQIGDGSAYIPVPLVDVLRALNLEAETNRRPPSFIFHTAYCASTFLSKCLAVDGVSVSLREPHLILDAANSKRMQWRSRTSNIDFRHFPSLAIRLLAKHADAGQKLIIKPVNSANNIIPELLNAATGASALLLYTDVRHFMLSTFKKGEQAKQRQRSMFDLLRCDFSHLSQLSVSDAISMSDLKLSLTLWRLQIDQAESVLSGLPSSDGLRSLHSELLINEVDSWLYRISQHLKIELTVEQIRIISNSKLVAQDAKDGEKQFSVSEREKSYKEIEALIGTDLDKGYRWMLNNNPTATLEPILSKPLKFD